MRIDCDQCGAVFSIDDKMITPRGVRAQCPRCSAQKVVKPADSAQTVNAANPFAAPAAAAPTTPSGAPAAAQNPFAAPTAPAAQNPFAAPTQPASQNPFGAPAGGAPSPAQNPFAAPTAPSASPAQNPFAPTTPAPAANPFAAAPVTKSKTGAMSDPFGSGPAASAPVAATDPFGAPAAKNPFSPAAGNAPPNANPFAPPNPGPPPAGADPFGGAGPAKDPFANAAPAASPFVATPVSDPFAAAGSPSPAPPPAGADAFGAASKSDLFGTPPATGASLADATQDRISLDLDNQNDASFDLPGDDAFAPPSAGGDPFEELGLDDGGPAPDSAAAQRWRVEATGGSTDDLSLDELRNMIRKGSLGPDDLAGPMGGSLRPIGDDPTLSISLPKVRKTAGGSPTGARAHSRSLPSGAIALVIVALVVGVVGVVAYGQRDKLFGSSVDSADNPFRRALSQWIVQFPDVDGTSQEQVVEGRRYMRADTAVGYRRADEHFRKALILDPGNLDAIVGFVENYANMPGVGAGADPQGIDLALAGVEYALARQKAHAGLLRAKGALLLGLGRVDNAQRELVQSQRLDPGDVSTKLLLARTHLERDAAEARRLVEEVQREAPELQSALPVAGGAHRRLGNYQKARDFLTSRLDSDPGNVPALFELARLELDLDRPQRAVNALRDLTHADEQDVAARLMMAKIQYQLMGKNADAERELAFVVDNLESVAGRLLLEALVHQAYLVVLRGDAELGAKIAERALGLDKTSASALFVLGRAYAKGGELQKAKDALERAVRVLPETPQAYFMPIVRTQLADVQVELGDTVNAKRNYDSSVRDDPGFIRGYLGLAATHMRAQETRQAATVMRRVINIDPRQIRDNQALVDFPTPASDLVKYANDYKKARALEAGRALKLMGEGIIRYQAEQTGKATALLKATLKSDPKNHGALLYLGAIALDKKNAREAYRRLNKAAKAAGAHAITHIYLAKAEVQLGKLVEAQHRLTDVIDGDPTSITGRFVLSELQLKRKNKSEASTILRQLLKDARDYRPVKRQLGQLSG